MGKELLFSWGLPAALYDVIEFYRYPERASTHKLEALVLNLASRLVDDRGFGRSVDQTLEDVHEQVLATLHLSRDHLGKIMEQADIEYLQVFEHLLPSRHSVHGIARPH